MPPRHLEYGYDVPRWPQLKHVRATGQFAELINRFELWQLSAPAFATTTFSDDRRSIELQLLVEREPPVDEWSLILGDILHNFASSLDSLAWALCALDGGVPKEPHRVYFPADTKQSAWAGRAKVLASVPAEMLERLRIIQPWTLPTPERSILHLLKVMNVEDKHRQLIAVDTGLRGFQLPQLGEEFIRHVRVIENSENQFVTGHHIGRLESPTPFPEHPRLDRLAVVPRIKVTVGADTWELTALVGVMLQLVEAVQEWVLRGEHRPPLMLKASEVPVPNNPPGILIEPVYIDEADMRRAQAGI